MNGLTINRIYKRGLLYAAMVTAATFSGAASAASVGGVFSTDRLGYTGTVVRYGSLADAQGMVNSTDTITVGVDVPGDDSLEHRDASFYFVNNAAAYDTDYNILTGSWWYSTTSGAGNGNINGNTGIGFMQLYDDLGVSDTSVSMDFSNFDGTHWTEFTLSAQGENQDTYSRFSMYNNVNDAGKYLEYDLNITVGGLQGLQAGNEIVANNDPTSVTGNFKALFQLGGDPQGDLNTDFYTVDLDFDMENWAFGQNGSLVGPHEQDGNIYDSQFVAINEVPLPAAAWLFGSALMGLIGVARRQKA